MSHTTRHRFSLTNQPGLVLSDAKSQEFQELQSAYPVSWSRLSIVHKANIVSKCSVHTNLGGLFSVRISTSNEGPWNLHDWHWNQVKDAPLWATIEKLSSQHERWLFIINSTAILKQRGTQDWRLKTWQYNWQYIRFIFVISKHLLAHRWFVAATKRLFRSTDASADGLTCSVVLRIHVSWNLKCSLLPGFFQISKAANAIIVQLQKHVKSTAPPMTNSRMYWRLWHAQLKRFRYDGFGLSSKLSSKKQLKAQLQSLFHVTLRSLSWEFIWSHIHLAQIAAWRQNTKTQIYSGNLSFHWAWSMNAKSI